MLSRPEADAGGWRKAMGWNEEEDDRIYKVVVNHEEQYSIWPADRENALGWNDAGKSGTKAEGLAYIKGYGPTWARWARARRWGRWGGRGAKGPAPTERAPSGQGAGTGLAR